MRKLMFVGFLLTLGAVVTIAVIWFQRCRIGQFSHCNFERIEPGMKLHDVEQLVGGPGVEVDESQLPGIVDWNVPLDSPKRIKPVIAGEKFYRWEDGSRYILISLNGGVVHEKWYWEPSL